MRPNYAPAPMGECCDDSQYAMRRPLSPDETYGEGSHASQDHSGNKPRVAGAVVQKTSSTDSVPLPSRARSIAAGSASSDFLLGQRSHTFSHFEEFAVMEEAEGEEEVVEVVTSSVEVEGVESSSSSSLSPSPPSRTSRRQGVRRAARAMTISHLPDLDFAGLLPGHGSSKSKRLSRSATVKALRAHAAKDKFSAMKLGIGFDLASRLDETVDDLRALDLSMQKMNRDMKAGMS
eukprot:TRINITY_DN25711_c0_g1_i1.p1 TRINITY_DN25711_c0_g1~~TRINITY_DN25711_c0_g1_i1.p1  ORF type:complete len:234 (-),score=31.48 TRINITY_DN25711_c0_g1_i1:391-1092(-)